MFGTFPPEGLSSIHGRPIGGYPGHVSKVTTRLKVTVNSNPDWILVRLYVPRDLWFRVKQRNKKKEKLGFSDL